MTITQSEKISVAAVILDQYDYILQSHGTDGWIVDSAVLFTMEAGNDDQEIPGKDDH